MWRTQRQHKNSSEGATADERSQDSDYVPSSGEEDEDDGQSGLEREAGSTHGRATAANIAQFSNKPLNEILDCLRRFKVRIPSLSARQMQSAG